MLKLKQFSSRIVEKIEYGAPITLNSVSIVKDIDIPYDEISMCDCCWVVYHNNKLVAKCYSVQKAVSVANKTLYKEYLEIKHLEEQFADIDDEEIACRNYGIGQFFWEKVC